MKSYASFFMKNYTLWGMKGSIFWDIRPCSPLKVNRRFGGTCRQATSSGLYALMLVSFLACSSTLKIEVTCHY
jgi:hypothetical protein